MTRLFFVLTLALAGCDDGAAPDATPSAVDQEAAAHPPGCPNAEPTAAEGPLPGASLYHLDHAFTDHRGETFDLSALRGDPVVLVFFYGSCTTACPMLLGDGVRLDEALPPEVRAQTRFVYVTIDPEHDTLAHLAKKASDHGLDDSRWRLVRGNERATRELASLVGVQYRATGDGHFAHSNVLTALDANGQVLAQIEGLNQPIGSLVEALRGARTH